jgi:hypothetical protein
VRVSVRGKLETRRKELELGLVGRLYTAAERASSRRRARRACQREGEDEHVFVLSTMRGEEVEDELLVLIFHEGVLGC